MSVALICISLLAFLVLALGFVVSLIRARTKTLFGASDETPDNLLFKAIRAHTNSIEYIPVLCLLIYILSLTEQALWVTVSIIAVTLCRYLLALGLILPKTMAKPNLARFVGALGTYVFGVLLVFAVFMQALAL